MPATRIDTRRGWIGDRRRDLLEAVQRALVTGLRIPAGDRSIVLAGRETLRRAGRTGASVKVERL